jgi:hypothetical protein
MSGAAPRGDVCPEIVSAFEPQFAAYDALYGFARSHRPSESAASLPTGRLIVATYARGSKTYQGALRLAYIAWGSETRFGG